jgi:hypothetical protein
VSLELPVGSRLRVTTDGADTVIVVPHEAGYYRYFIGLFVLAWLGGWVAGGGGALTRLLSRRTIDGASAFLALWLVAWAVGSVMALYMVYRALRPSVPESLRLASHGVSYDSGVPPLRMNYGDRGRKDAWRSMFPRRTRVELDRRQLQSLRLRETGDGNRLTVDADARRVDLAQGASEIEREWLYQVLAKRYGLRPPER